MILKNSKLKQLIISIFSVSHICQVRSFIYIVKEWR